MTQLLKPNFNNF